MFKINYSKETGYIEIFDTSIDTYAKIFLNFGASVQILTLDNKPIIKDLHPLSYSKSVASGILFPFANRIEDGKYNFLKEDYQLAINQEEENNAIHGFVFEKPFELVEQQITNTEATVGLKYVENTKTSGFPFEYTIQLNYTLTKNALNLSVVVQNLSTKPFPFTLGWHPYFCSSNLDNSYLKFDSNKKIEFDNRMITKGVENIKIENNIKLNLSQLDDCYILNNNKVSFITPDFDLEISATSKENYLQLYIPNKANTIAIEPCTAPSNSFNNKMGLQVLKPKEVYNLTWKIELKETTN